MEVERAAEWRGATIDDFLRVGDVLIPRCGGDFRIEPGCLDLLGVPPLDDDVEEEWPDVKLVLIGSLFPDWLKDRIKQAVRQVLVPWLDDVRLNHLDHFQERRHADIHVPGTGLLSRLGQESVDTKVCRWSNLSRYRVSARELGVNRFDIWMQVNDPVVVGDLERSLFASQRRTRGLVGERCQHWRAETERGSPSQECSA